MQPSRAATRHNQDSDEFSSRSDPGIPVKLARACALLAMAAGAVALCGWWLGQSAIRDQIQNYFSMKANSALAVLLLGLAIFIESYRDTGGWRRTLGKLSAGTAAVIGLATLLESAFDWNFGIDLLLAMDATAGYGLAPGRMASQTALGLLLMGIAVLALDWHARRSWWPAQLLAVGAVFFPLQVWAATLYGSFGPLETDFFLGMMSRSTATVFVLLAIGALLTRTDCGILRWFISIDSAKDRLETREFQRTLRRIAYGSLGCALAFGLSSMVVLAAVTRPASRMSYVNKFVAEARTVERMMVDMETGLRGYLLTGDKLFLAPYVAADAALTEEMQKLAEIVDDGEIFLRVQQVQVAFEEWRKFAREALARRERGSGYDDVAFNSHGKELMDNSRSTMAMLRSEVDSLRGVASRRLTQSGRWLFGVLVLFLFVMGPGASLLLQRLLRRATDTYRANFAAASRTAEELRVTLESIGDAVIATDKNGRVAFLNTEAVRLTGWTAAAATGRSLDEVFRIINEQTRRSVDSPVAHVLREGKTVGLANHTVLLSRDGREMPIEDSAAPIRDADGEMLGVILVFHDATQARDSKRRIEQSESQLRFVTDHAAVLIVHVDSEYRLKYVNETFARYFGLTREEVIGKRVAEIAGERAFTQIRPYIDRALSGEAVEWENEVPFSRLGPRWMHVAYEPERSEDGKVVGYVAVMSDVTERRRMQRALSDSERRLRTVMDLVPHFIFAKDRKGRYLFVNRAFAESYGMTPEQLAGRTDRELIPDQSQYEAFHRDDLKVIESGAPLFIAAEARTNSRGATQIMQTTKIPFTAPGTNEPAVLGVAVDITERQRAQEIAERFAAIVKSTDDAIISKDLNGIVTSWNPGAERIFGYTANEVVGKSIKMLFPPGRVEEETTILTRVGRGEAVEHFESVRVRKDSTNIDVAVTISPLKDASGKVVGASKIARDITGRKESARLIEAALHEKEILLKEIHHRVKNNMQVISSLVNLQAESVADPAQREVFGEVRARVRAMALVHEKLYQSKDFASVDFAEYVKSLMRHLMRGYGAAAARVSLRLEMDPVKFSVDTAVPCALILNELTTNALKHAFRGRASGEIAVALRRGDAGEALLTFRDNGNGLPPGTDWRQSTSLGLRLVDMLARQLSATVEVDAGHGTEFRLRFKDANLRA